MEEQLDKIFFLYNGQIYTEQQWKDNLDEGENQ